MLSSFIVRYGYYYELSINLIGHRHNLFHSHLAAFENRLIDNKFNSVNRLIAHSKASPAIMNFKTINSKRRHFLFGVIFFLLTNVQCLATLTIWHKFPVTFSCEKPILFVGWIAFRNADWTASIWFAWNIRIPFQFAASIFQRHDSIEINRQQLTHIYILNPLKNAHHLAFVIWCFLIHPPIINSRIRTHHPLPPHFSTIHHK